MRETANTEVNMSNMVVRTNMLALNSHRNLGMVGTQQARASARLSSGFRINSAADDAAGLGISENMRAQIRGLDQASRNAQDAISLVQTAEGGLSTINDMVIRIRELTVQAANDINTSEGAGSLGTNESNRARIQGEINHLIDEIQRTATTLEFNSMTLLNGELSGVSLNQILNDSTLTAIGQITLTAGALDPATNIAQRENLNSLLGILNQAGVFGAHPDATGALVPLTAAQLDALLVAAGATGADANLPVPVLTNAEVVAFLNTVGGGTLAGAVGDGGVFAAGSARADLLTFINDLRLDHEDPAEDLTIGRGLFMQIGANSGQGINIAMPNIVADVAQSLRGTFGSPPFNLVTNDSSVGSVAEGSGITITALLDDVDAVLAVATSARGALGAIQNRLEFTIQNLDVSSENLSASNSRIRDADMALEMMRLTQANVLQQAATAMLAQGNQAPQSILQLLG